MSDIRGKIQKIYSLEQLAGKTGVIHERHPAVKLVSTLAFIVLIVSFDRFELLRLIPFVFYPAVIMALSDTPWGPVVRRCALALPFCLLAGLSNVIFIRDAAFMLGPVVVSLGVVSFLSILLRSFLCVCAVLILIAVTPFGGLTGQLRAMRVPEVFVSLFEMTYRYIGVLLEEAASMHTAYMLRGNSPRGLQMRHMGSFVGHLLIRSFDRAERVYAAMKCRGYAARDREKSRRPADFSDWLYLCCTCIPFIFLRVFDLTAVFEKIF